MPVYSRLRRALLSDGATIVAASFFVQSGLRVVSNLILTRLLYPEAFGLMSIVSSVLIVLELSSDFGIKAFLIRHPSLGPEVLDTTWTIQVIRNAVLTLILVCLAQPISHFYGRSELSGALLLISLNIAIGGVRSISYFVAEREQRFFKISMLETSLFLLQIVITVALAYFLKSYWALLIASILSTAATTVASYVAFPNSIRRFSINRDVFRNLWAFSSIIIPSSILHLVISQSDKLLIGKAFDLHVLGVYSIAASMVAMFTQLAGKIIVSVMYPRLAKAFRETPDRMNQAFYKERTKFVPILLFATSIFFPLGPLVFSILYDSRYSAGGQYFVVLLLIPVLKIISQSSEICLAAMGRIKASLAANLMRAVWLGVTFFPLYLGFHIWGVLSCIALAELPALIYFMAKLKQIGIFDYWREVGAIFYVGAGVSLGFLVVLLGTMAFQIF